MERSLQQIKAFRLVPVVKIETSRHAAALGQALIEGGLPIAEITYRTDAAQEAIRILTVECPEIVVGAGTVLTIEQVDTAIHAGARFIVTPGFNPTVVDYCIAHSIPIIPGVNNPSQIERALARDLEVVKFFPAEASGGTPFLKAVSAAYGQIQFMPTGGITPENTNAYLALPQVIACGGSWMVDAKLISAENFAEISVRSRQAVDTVRKQL